MTISYQCKQQIPSGHYKLIHQGKYQLEIDNYLILEPINKEGPLNVGSFSGNAFILAQIGREGRKIGVINDCLRFEREGEAKPPISDDNDTDNDDDDGGGSNGDKTVGSNPNPNNQLPVVNSNLVGRVEELEKQLRQLSVPVPDDSLARRIQELEGQLQRLLIPAPDNGLPGRVQELEGQLKRLSPLVTDNNLTRRVNNLESQIKDATRSDRLQRVETGSYKTPYLPGRTVQQWVSYRARFKQTPSVVTNISMADVDKGANFRLKVRAENVTSQGFTLSVQTWADTKLYSCTVSWVAVGT